jgi:hypothetical protein
MITFINLNAPYYHVTLKLLLWISFYNLMDTFEGLDFT